MEDIYCNLMLTSGYDTKRANVEYCVNMYISFTSKASSWQWQMKRPLFFLSLQQPASAQHRNRFRENPVRMRNAGLAQRGGSGRGPAVRRRPGQQLPRVHGRSDRRQRLQWNLRQLASPVKTRSTTHVKIVILTF